MHLDTQRTSAGVGQIGVFTSPALGKKTAACLSFAYIIPTTSKVVSLRVESVTSRERRRLMTISTNSMKSWNVTNISLCAEPDTKVIIIILYIVFYRA